MDKILFQKITITQIQYINVQQILVVTFEFTDAARGYMIMSCAARGVKKVGQHCWTSIKTESSSIDGFRIINDLKLEFSRLRIQTKCIKKLLLLYHKRRYLLWLFSFIVYDNMYNIDHPSYAGM